jgi:hypothetical protein
LAVSVNIDKYRQQAHHERLVTGDRRKERKRGAVGEEWLVADE